MFVFGEKQEVVCVKFEKKQKKCKKVLTLKF